ncbi:hypothetical protein ACFQRL_03190 [Microbacterium fluvii]|uniref:Uncharacterized protein n=1 Tax=Microbacterium fluvii TaxID=415215 RepID=A0ABW2HDY1_9MICO|nr:hypothetical protein [Microbacterium fluvii]MCU4671599.1 hypothetical protein [Microbacterium fluvii]
MTGDDHAPGTVARTVRRVVVWIIVVAFALAAIGGITVLVGGRLDDTGYRVLGTTSLVGAFSLAVLCCLTLVGRRAQLFGLIGAAIAVATAVCSLVLVWAPWSWDLWSDMYRMLWTGVVLTSASALASLLLMLADRRRTVVRIGLLLTLALFAIVTAMLIVQVWADELDWEVYPRVLGIFAILAALGAIVVPVLSILLPDDAGIARGDVSRELGRRLVAEAARRGITVEELVAPVLTAHPEAVAAPAEPQ